MLLTSILRSFRKRKKSFSWIGQKRKLFNTISTQGKSSAAVPTTPIKRKEKSLATTRRNLFGNNAFEETVDEMELLFNTGSFTVEKWGTSPRILQFYQIDKPKKFPNKAFLLLLDVVRWYSIPNTSIMYYSQECMKF